LKEKKTNICLFFFYPRDRFYRN